MVGSLPKSCVIEPETDDHIESIRKNEGEGVVFLLPGIAPLPSNQSFPYHRTRSGDKEHRPVGTICHRGMAASTVVSDQEKEEPDMQLVTVRIEKPEAINFILGQTHFIKSVEDIHEALVGAVHGIK